jgi:hypothetical protein
MDERITEQELALAKALTQCESDYFKLGESWEETDNIFKAAIFTCVNIVLARAGTRQAYNEKLR